MAEIDESLTGGSSSPSTSPYRVFKSALADDKDGRYVTPRKQRLPTMDRLSNSSLVAEDQLEVNFTCIWRFFF